MGTNFSNYEKNFYEMRRVWNIGRTCTLNYELSTMWRTCSFNSFIMERTASLSNMEKDRSLSLSSSGMQSDVVWCSVLQRDAVCCSVLQGVAVCCSAMQCNAVRCFVLQYVVVCCSVLQCVTVCYSVLQCVAVCCSVLQCVATEWTWSDFCMPRSLALSCSGLQYVAVRCSVLQCAPVVLRCPALQRVAVYFGVLQWVELYAVGSCVLQLCAREACCIWGGYVAKEPYKRDYILQKRPIILRSLLIVATPYSFSHKLKVTIYFESG